MEFESKMINLDGYPPMKIQVWDTAGQETFKSLVKTFYRGSAAILLVYDVNCR